MEKLVANANKQNLKFATEKSVANLKSLRLKILGIYDQKIGSKFKHVISPNRSHFSQIQTLKRKISRI